MLSRFGQHPRKLLLVSILAYEWLALRIMRIARQREHKDESEAPGVIAKSSVCCPEMA